MNPLVIIEKDDYDYIEGELSKLREEKSKTKDELIEMAMFVWDNLTKRIEQHGIDERVTKETMVKWMKDNRHSTLLDAKQKFRDV